MPRPLRSDWTFATSPLFSGESLAACPLYVSEHGEVEAPPVTSHLYGQLRLMSRPTQVLVLTVWRFFLHKRSVVWE